MTDEEAEDQLKEEEDLDIPAEDPVQADIDAGRVITHRWVM